MGKTKDVSHQELMEVINSFDFGGKLEEVGIFGNGHINETYCAVFSTEAGQKRYILQKMNRRIIIQILITPFSKILLVLWRISVVSPPG